MWEISPVVTSLIFLLFGAIVIFGIKKEIDISPNSNISGLSDFLCKWLFAFTLTA